MRTTIKVGGGKALVIEPAELSGGVNFNVTVAGFTIGGMVITAAECGAVIFAMEQALEVLEARAVPA